MREPLDDHASLEGDVSATEDAPPRLTRAAPPVAQPPIRLARYRVIGLIGYGGMGAVYHAHDEFLDRDVAIKVVKEPSEHRYRRFLIEARAAARIQHPNVVTVFDVARNDEHLYIVSEYIRGESLDAHKPLPWREVLRIGRGLGRGLAAAHKLGILHRDIKPANAILAETGEPKLIDFGLAKLTGSAEPRGGRDAAHGADDLSSPAYPIGTRSYAAPELHEGRSATERCDVYSLGVLLYELCTGHVPFRAGGPGHHQAPRLEEEIPARGASDRERIHPRFAAIVHRCLERNPDERYASASELSDALQELDDSNFADESTTGNPYRGLERFENAHRTLFFGRDTEIRETIDSLHRQPCVVLAGESGVGKSSLARAGIMPRIAAGVLDVGRQWTALAITPGRKPLRALVTCLAERLRIDEAYIRAAIDVEHNAGIRNRLIALHQATPRTGTLLVIDQLEELVTVSDDRQDAERAAKLLSALAEPIPGMRLLATVRADHLGHVANLPGLDAILRAGLRFVGPLSSERLRQTIVEPARKRGTEFESEELIGELADSAAESGEGGLPLLQFTLAQLWDARDIAKNRITRDALESVGGVAGALSRHADRVLDRLYDRDEADAARHILLHLVTGRRTRAKRSHEELTSGDRFAERALNALVQGRLVVTGKAADGAPVYELAHEALVSSWTRLRHWLDKEGDIRAVKERLADAAENWERLSRPKDALWGPTQLAEATGIDHGELPRREREFLQASFLAVKRARWLRHGMALALITAAGLVYWGVRYQASQRVDTKLRAADQALAQARQKKGELLATHRRAMELLREDTSDSGAMEVWENVIRLAKEVDAGYRAANHQLDVAFSMGGNGEDLMARIAAVLTDQVDVAAAMLREEERNEFLQRLLIYDNDRYKHLVAPARVTVGLNPPPGSLSVEQYVALSDGTYKRDIIVSGMPVEKSFEVEPGSYVILIHGNDTHPEIRFPVRLSSGEQSISIERLAPKAIPKGFVYVPEGEFLYGYGTGAAAEERRTWWNAVPLHTRDTGPYLIARYETTYAQWIEFLEACATDDCLKYQSLKSPATTTGGLSIELTRHPSGRWSLTLTAPDGATKYQALSGDLIEYPERMQKGPQDWMKMPVSGVDYGQVQRYLQWLRESYRVPGARLCREDEWERAGRGADGRLYPHGNRLLPSDVNIDKTYGQKQLAFGPDAVGLHPVSQSVYGLHDMAGNVWEMTEILRKPDAATGSLQTQGDNAAPNIVVRGGSYFQDAGTAALVNRQLLPKNQPDVLVGFRVCADL